MADDAVARKAELNDQLKEYISEWRKTREAEEEELQKLKEKQAKRKEIRAEQEKKLNAAKKEEEERGKGRWEKSEISPRFDSFYEREETAQKPMKNGRKCSPVEARGSMYTTPRLLVPPPPPSLTHLLLRLLLR